MARWSEREGKSLMRGLRSLAAVRHHATFGRAVAVLCLGLLLGGCASAEKLIDKVSGGDEGVNPPGAREGGLPQSPLSIAQRPAGERVVLPAAVGNSSWPQPGGVPSHALHNLA